MSNREIRMPPLVRCPFCEGVFMGWAEEMERYFSGKPSICPKCNKELNWWVVVRNFVQKEPGHPANFTAIGAQVGYFPIKVTPGEVASIKFEDHGLPEDGRMLFITYHPQGPTIRPLEVHRNVPPRHIVPREVTLFPQPSPELEPTVTEVWVRFGWAPHGAGDESWQSIVDALEAYIHSRFINVIIPANVAVESRLSRVLNRILSPTAANKNVEYFLSDAATYSHQLNVVLPAVLEPRGIPLLPDEIRGALNSLRKKRNELVHKGQLAESLDQTKTAELLCAAFFGFRYLAFVEQKLDEAT